MKKAIAITLLAFGAPAICEEPEVEPNDRAGLETKAVLLEERFVAISDILEDIGDTLEAICDTTDDTIDIIDELTDTIDELPDIIDIDEITDDGALDTIDVVIDGAIVAIDGFINQAGMQNNRELADKMKQLKKTKEAIAPKSQPAAPIAAQRKVRTYGSPALVDSIRGGWNLMEPRPVLCGKARTSQPSCSSIRAGCTCSEAISVSGMNTGMRSFEEGRSSQRALQLAERQRAEKQFSPRASKSACSPHLGQIISLFM